MFCFSMFKVWILALLQVSQSCWMWCTIQGIFILCVVSVVTSMVIDIDIGAHDKYCTPHLLAIEIFLHLGCQILDFKMKAS